MKHDFLDISAHVVDGFDVPLDPRLLGGLLDQNVEIEGQTTYAIGDVLDPGSSLYIEPTLARVQKTDKEMQNE